MADTPFHRWMVDRYCPDQHEDCGRDDCASDYVDSVGSVARSDIVLQVIDFPG